MIKYILVLSTVMQVSLAEQPGYLIGAQQVSDKMWIGGQPNEQDFNELAAYGIEAVINTRLATEMKQIGFNESGLARDLEVAYDLLEVGKGHPYSPDKLAEFNVLMETHKGKNMLLHCRSGNRATQLYTAWLIKYQNQTVADALQIVGSSGTELNHAVKALLGLK